MIDVLSIIAEDRRVISYRPSLNQITGSVLGSIFFQQVIFRWVTNGRKPFYKFNRPCRHPLYRPGDSWVEELGFSRSELNSARSSVAQKTTSSGVEEDLPGNLVVYYTDMDRRTYYVLNEPEVVRVLSEHYVMQDSGITENQDSDITKDRIPSLRNEGNLILINNREDHRRTLQRPQKERGTPPLPDVVRDFLIENKIPLPLSVEDRDLIVSGTAVDWFMGTGVFPGYKGLRFIVGKLGPDGVDVDRLRDVWSEWINSGNRSRNLVGVVDWYQGKRKFSKPTTNGSGTGTAADALSQYELIIEGLQ